MLTVIFVGFLNKLASDQNGCWWKSYRKAMLSFTNRERDTDREGKKDLAYSSLYKIILFNIFRKIPTQISQWGSWFIWKVKYENLKFSSINGYIRKNSNKVNYTKRRGTVVDHFLPWYDQENCSTSCCFSNLIVTTLNIDIIWLKWSKRP